MTTGIKTRFCYSPIFLYSQPSSHPPPLSCSYVNIYASAAQEWDLQSSDQTQVPFTLKFSHPCLKHCCCGNDSFLLSQAVQSRAGLSVNSTAGSTGLSTPAPCLALHQLKPAGVGEALCWHEGRSGWGEGVSGLVVGWQACWRAGLGDQLASDLAPWFKSHSLLRSAPVV